MRKSPHAADRKCPQSPRPIQPDTPLHRLLEWVARKIAERHQPKASAEKTT